MKLDKLILQVVNVSNFYAAFKDGCGVFHIAITFSGSVDDENLSLMVVHIISVPWAVIVHRFVLMHLPYSLLLMDAAVR
ncbi:MAG: hypothetical protein U0Z17_07450 [Bacteroidales bacterium]